TSTDQVLAPRMEAALADPGLERSQRVRLLLALGKAADDLGDPASAMQRFDEADAARRGSRPFDSAAFDMAIDRLIERADPELSVRAAEKGSRDETPVLIVGMPRAGTTLVEQILSSHPDVEGGGELNFWNERGANWLTVQRDAEAQFVKQAASDYLDVLRTIGPNVARVTDKMPFNFLWVGLIHLAFPFATIIHCRRSAIDTALSIHQTLFHPGLAFPTGGPELVAYFRSYRRLTDHWRRTLSPDRFVEIDYENLAREPEPVMRRIVAACGLPWNEACLRPENNSRAVRTPSKWQTRQPVYRSSVERWRRYAPWLGPLSALEDGP
ncbi:MAG TPA: sulfotransferase, partial [Roseiarcus sp.]|nr:sulfotransferase [Roseiarcus sp.]